MNRTTKERTSEFLNWSAYATKCNTFIFRWWWWWKKGKRIQKWFFSYRLPLSHDHWRWKGSFNRLQMERQIRSIERGYGGSLGFNCYIFIVQKIILSSERNRLKHNKNNEGKVLRVHWKEVSQKKSFVQVYRPTILPLIKIDDILYIEINIDRRIRVGERLYNVVLLLVVKQPVLQ